MNSKKENCLARDKEFLELFNATYDFMLHNYVPDAFNAALQWAIEQGQPRYWLSFNRAYRVMCQMMAGETLHFINPMRKRMWDELFGKVKALTGQHPSISTAQALAFVLEHTRPSQHFFTRRQAMRALQRCRKHKRLLLQENFKKRQS